MKIFTKKTCLTMIAAALLVAVLWSEQSRIAGFHGASPAETAVDKPYRVIRWEELIPSWWHPAELYDVVGRQNLADSDPGAAEAMQRLRALMDSAPAEPAMNGERIRISGFPVPLEFNNEAGEHSVREFLLVPYFGACIHTPPPPANQIIHVQAKSIAQSIEPMVPIWVEGTLSVSPSVTDMGHSTYRLHADNVEIYTLPNESR